MANDLASRIYTALKAAGVKMDIAQAGTIQQAIDDAEAERWIPTSKRLPETNKSVLIFESTNGICDIGSLSRGGFWRISCGGRWPVDFVTYWTPLLEPPPGERAETGECDEAWPDTSGYLEAGE